MFKLSSLAAIFAAALMGLMWAAPAQAQATRTWISGVGDDVNPCSRTAPCKTFAGAISKTAAGGEIDTLDPGGFGAVTVTKAMTLANEGIGEAGILVAGTNGVTVNCATDPTCVVILRGLVIDGGPIGSNSLNGVRFVAGAGLVVENCTIRNFTGGSPNGYGIQFNNNSAASLYVINSTLTTNGQAGNAATGGILVLPQSGAGNSTTKVTLRNVQVIQGAGIGLQLNTTGLTGTGKIVAEASNSVFDGNAGIALNIVGPSGTIPATLTLKDIVASNNDIAGVVANGPLATIRMGRSLVTGNGTGIAGINTGKMNTYGDNEVNSNTTDGTATAPTLTPL
jgi:hypothetical protein